jgi:molybdopterin synthase catalytic subunit
MIKVTSGDFDVQATIDAAARRSIGAFVTFVGVVRDDGIERMYLEADCFAAEEELSCIRTEAVDRFGVETVDIIHRVGDLRVGDPIVLIIVGASHRRAAFQACEYIIDRIKESVPIWKKEYTPDGTRWVPGEHEDKKTSG